MVLGETGDSTYHCGAFTPFFPSDLALKSGPFSLESWNSWREGCGGSGPGSLSPYSWSEGCGGSGPGSLSPLRSHAHPWILPLQSRCQKSCLAESRHSRSRESRWQRGQASQPVLACSTWHSPSTWATWHCSQQVFEAGV